VAKGNYAIAIGSSPLIINQFLAQGVKSLRVVPNWEWRDTMVMSSGFGDVYGPAQTAHPAASKLFVNWLITHNGQLALSRGLGYPSRRIDVPVDHVPEYLRAKPGVRYIESDDERFIAGDEVKRTMAVLKEIEFGKQ
ncbi:MAG: hypothetical protein AB7P12_19740, partial [Alphaproteobacteria bacterium]